MAKVSKYQVDMDRVNDGEWVECTLSDGATFEIKTRGYTKEYQFAFNEAVRRSVDEANRNLKPGQVRYDGDSLPAITKNECQGKALAEYLVLDVRGLENDDDSPLTVEQFKTALCDPFKNGAFVLMAIFAAGYVHGRRTGKTVDLGNGSAAPSASQ